MVTMTSVPVASACVRRPRRLPFICLLVAGAALCACGDEGGSGGTNHGGNVDESAAPTSNGLFTYEPEGAGAAPGFVVEATVGGEVIVSDEVEVILLPESEYRSTIADLAAGDGTETRPSALAVPAPPLQGRAELAHISFGAARAADLSPRTMESLVEAFDPRPRFERGTVLRMGAALRDRDGDGVPEDDSVAVCTGGQVTGCSDNCPFVQNADQADENLDRIGDACAEDPDGDNIGSDGDDSGTAGDAPCASTVVSDCDDNCPAAPNPRQWDTDGDGIGDACDTDLDGNGVPDLNEGAVDHDNDGVATADEGDVDSDADGIPDYLDADDDGDGIPSALEDDDDPSRDTDDDDIPDRRDDDSDGDGVPDRAEGTRDTDDDGTPDSRDTDDDGDGTDTADEGTGDVDGDGIPDWLDEDDDDGCAERAVGGLYEDIPTFNGWTYWNSFTGSVLLPATDCQAADFPFCTLHEYTWANHYAPDGLYFSLQFSEGIEVTLDVAGIGLTHSMGLMHSPESDPQRISAETMSTGRNLGISWEPAPFTSVGFGMLEEIVPGTSGPGFPALARFMQFDTGIGISYGPGLVGISFLPDFIPALAITDGGITIERSTDTGSAKAFLLVSGVGDRCPGAPNQTQSTRTNTQAQTAPALRDFAATAQAGAASPPTDALDANRQEAWASVAPLAEMLSSPTGTGSAQFVPAPTAADWVNEFVTSDADSACSNCANASIDGIIARTSDAVDASENSANQLSIGVAEEAALMEAVWPERERMNSLVTYAAAGSTNAVTTLAFDVAARRRGDAWRFMRDETVEIDAVAGQAAPFVITAEEISDLIGYPAADIEGATVCVENNPQIDRVCGVIEGGELSGTITPGGAEDLVLPVEVNLSTAAGRFNDHAVERWVVRPATRVFRVSTGSPARVVLAVPSTLISGGVATFNATLVNDDGLLVRESATFRLIDYAGVEIASHTTDTGAAIFQIQPQAVTPVVDTVEVRAVEVSGQQVPGYVIRGTGFSSQATFELDGRSAVDRGYAVTVADSKSAGVAVIDGSSALGAGTHTVIVRNPGDRTSDAVEFTVP